MPIEEDPQVVMADVLASVARATAAALPWLHLGGRSGDEVRHRRDASQADADAETALRLRAAMGNRESGDAGGRHGPGSAVQVNLLEEALGAARDFMAEPLTWMLGVPLLLAVFMISVLRGRGK